jgi:hypothetical protein
MNISMKTILATSILTLTFTTLAAIAEGASGAPPPKTKVLVIAGGHGYSINQFRAVFRGYGDMDCTFADEKNVAGESFDDISKWHYDAIVLYNYKKTLSPQQQANFLKLMDRGVGLVILHHAIYGYRPWPEFQKIVGVTSWLAGSKNNITMKIHVEDPQHPLTKGLADFTITDETYHGHTIAPECHILLTTDEPSNARAISWVHTYRKSPVCYLQLGHGVSAYDNPHFAEYLRRAIRWSAGLRAEPEMAQAEKP